MTLVVMEAQHGQRKMWAWCRPAPTGGFGEITYTDTSGQPVDLVTEPKIGRFLFTIDDDTEERRRVVRFTDTFDVDHDEDDAWGIAFERWGRFAADNGFDIQVDVGPVRRILRYRRVYVTLWETV